MSSVRFVWFGRKEGQALLCIASEEEKNSFIYFLFRKNTTEYLDLSSLVNFLNSFKKWLLRPSWISRISRNKNYQMAAEEYLGRLVEYCHLKVTCLLRVVETGSSLKIWWRLVITIIILKDEIWNRSVCTLCFHTITYFWSWFNEF